MKSLITAITIGSIAASPHAWAGKDKNIVETAVSAGTFQTLTAALKAADLVKPLEGKAPLTVFAPTDEAFGKLPKGTVKDLLKPENKTKLQEILKYHVIAGNVGLSDALVAKSAKTLQGEPVKVRFSNGKVMVNDSGLINADLRASNGVIHVIDKVLLPPAPKNDIASVAEKAGKFGTLLAAVKAAGLESALTGSKAITVLAPTDAAFKALPKGTVESLLKPENIDKLKEILLYHVIEGSVSAGDALNAGKAKTLAGQKVGFAINDGKFQVNGSTIVTTDIQCDNGVIYVIDAVLIPESKSANSKCQSTASGTMAPAKMIADAIDRGVPVFNHGNHDKCSEIYMNCVKALAKHDQIGGSMKNALVSLAEKASEMDCSTRRSWVLRHGLDQVFASLSH